MKTYWKGIEELKTQNEHDASGKMHQEDESLIRMLNQRTAETTRRDFLKTFGFSIAGAAVLASCKRPVTEAIPYLIQPQDIVPGKSNFYASYFYDGEQYCSILVKVRDGRPIKIEGNDLSPLTFGRTSAITQGSLLELYDDNRIRKPMVNGRESTWEETDKTVRSMLEGAKGKTVLLTSSLIGPSTRKVIRAFTSAHRNAEHIVYDPVSMSALLDANQASFGRRIIPDYRFDKAMVILSFGADFLGSWISPVEYAAGYIKNRKAKESGGMSRHIQLETGMSVTGSSADERISIRPSEERLILARLYARLTKETGGGEVPEDLPECPVDVENLAGELLQNKERALVVSGSNELECQLLVNGINHLLGSYGHTIDLNRPFDLKQGDDVRMENLLTDMEQGKVSGVIFHNVNPVYDYPEAERFRAALDKLDFSVSMATANDETSKACTVVCPAHHFLESWNDAAPKKGFYSLQQPAIRHIFDTRQFEESLMKWSGNNASYYETIKSYWKKELFPGTAGFPDFIRFWNKSLRDGIYESGYRSGPQPAFRTNSLETALKDIPEPQAEGTLELALYVPVNIGSGRYAGNPWLQETPDAVSRITWDNYAAISPRHAGENGLETGDVVLINGKYEIPVLVQPGQKYGTLSVALGYGREVGNKAALGAGRNFYPLMDLKKGRKIRHRTVTMEKTGKKYRLASTQPHHSMEGRALVREATLGEYNDNPAAGNEMHEEIEKHLDSLYKAQKFEGHHWGMSVDLSSCIGCNACVVACTAENNVPVVGKEQVIKAHEMHWIRIDRYYSGDPEHPDVLRQPVLCQHCDDAPCENVCPVAATTHSHEGLNMMVYNRCVGTRYCENNCPYKVRRFNWLDFNKADAIPNNTWDPEGMTVDLTRMVLNPDVTVRAKGVMEKCSFCVQRIQEKKLQAKLDGRPLEDGEIKTACQQVCPTQAITFGDLNDKDSKLVGQVNDERSYHLLEELHTLPSVSYMTRIRNRENEA